MPGDVVMGHLRPLCEEDGVVGDPEVEHCSGANDRQHPLWGQRRVADRKEPFAVVDKVDSLANGVAEGEQLAPRHDGVGELFEE